MNKTVYINTTTMVSAATSTQTFLITKLNHILVGIPLYTFKWSFPEMEFLPYVEVDIGNGTFVAHGDSYVINEADDASLPSERIGVALTTGPRPEGCNPGAFAFPIFKIDKQLDTSMDIGLKFENATLVSDLTSTGYFYVVSVNNKRYGIPTYFYSKVYPFTETLPQSSINVNTLLNISPTLNNETSQILFAGSTNLNSKIKTYADLIQRIKMQLGWPVVQVEVCDEQIVDFIDQAIEWYTKYAGYTEEFLVFDSNIYKPGVGVKMDDLFTQLYCMRELEPRVSNKQSKYTEHNILLQDYDLDSYRKVIDIWSFDEGGHAGGDFLFSMEYIFAQQTYFSYVLGNYGFDLVTWHILKDWIDTREKMFALKRRYSFDEKNQILRLIPEPTSGQRFVGVIGAYVERAIKDIISERWVFFYALALTKITLGHIRGKFGSVQLFGGGTINAEVGAQGLEEKNRLEEELLDKHGEVSPNKFFIG